MQLAHVGPRGRERPIVRGPDGPGYDLRRLTERIDGPFLADRGIERIRDELAHDRLEPVDLDGQRFGAPIARPQKLLCIGLNYRDHAREAGLPVPEEPILFGKANNTVSGPDDPLLLPPSSTATDWEVELAVVIGSQARYLSHPDDAWGYIAGFAISHDVSERHWQHERGGQWIKGKSFETFNPLGPWLVPRDDIGDVGSLRLQLRVNGEIRQDGNTSEMIFNVEHLVWYLSQFLVLEPGDVINTGTPAGVGMGSQPPTYLQEGDEVELAIEGLGTQRHPCQRASWAGKNDA